VEGLRHVSQELMSEGRREGGRKGSRFLSEVWVSWE
jgi:hypothetical protein